MMTGEGDTARSDEELARLPLAFRSDLFRNQIVLVSGAGSGIGRACAHWFARFGARLVLCGRDAEKLEDTAAALASYGAETLVHPMSIRDPEAVAALFDAARDRFGGIDVLVNNAGGQFAQPAIDFKPRGWQAVIDTNLNGTWYMMQAAARLWQDQRRRGSIVNIVAVVDKGLPGMAHTAAARAGIIHASKTVAVEWAPLGIRVNCVAPGVTASGAAYPPEIRAAYARSNPMMRFGSVEEIANAVCFLASDETGGFVTGEVLAVDGGYRLWGEQWAIPRPAYFGEER